LRQAAGRESLLGSKERLIIEKRPAMEGKLSSRIKFTYQDYLHLGEDKRYQIIEGELKVVPSPGTSHQRVSGRLEFLLRDFVRHNRLGEIFDAPYDVVLSEENVLQPDILFVSQEHSEKITERNLQGAPDLLIEIISPASEYQDREIKRKLYAKFGVAEYWLVDPDKKTIEVASLGESGLETIAVYQENSSLESPLLRQLSLKLSEVFTP